MFSLTPPFYVPHWLPVTFTSISHYQITGTLGQGGMGVVYKAFDEKLQRTVAIKTLPPDRVADEKLRKRLMSEARAASTLNHPNICTIYEVDEADGILFIAMEYVKGHALSDEFIGDRFQLKRRLISRFRCRQPWIKLIARTLFTATSNHRTSP
jgi:serine/threonine protein kinase